MQGLNHRLSGLYEEFAETPELAKFHRFLGLWSWSLNARIGKIQKLCKEIKKLVAEVQGVPSERSVLEVTDYHQIYDDGDHPELNKKNEELTELLRQYGMLTCCPRSDLF